MCVSGLIGLKELSPKLRDQLMVPLGDRALMEARAKGQTSDAIKKLLGLAPKIARVIRAGVEIDIPL